MTNGQQALPGRAEPAAVRPTSNIVDPTRLLVASAVCQSVRPLDTTSGRALTARSVAASLERAPAAPARPLLLLLLPRDIMMRPAARWRRSSTAATTAMNNSVGTAQRLALSFLSHLRFSVSTAVDRLTRQRHNIVECWPQRSQTLNAFSSVATLHTRDGRNKPGMLALGSPLCG